jgi:hypothetical protein
MLEHFLNPQMTGPLPEKKVVTPACGRLSDYGSMGFFFFFFFFLKNGFQNKK